MIGLVDLEPSAACAWAISLKSLPEPPALKCSAFVIRCDYQVPMDAVIPWFERVRSGRPHVPIGAVVRAAVPSLISAMRHGIQFMPLIEEHELDQGLLPLHILETVREHAVDGRLLVVWRMRWNLQGPEAESLAAAAAAVGVTGGGLTALCRRLQCSQATLYRRFRQIGLPAPGKLLAIARVTAVQIRIDLGMNAATARAAAGWFSSTAYRKARSRWAVRRTGPLDERYRVLCNSTVLRDFLHESARTAVTRSHLINGAAG